MRQLPSARLILLPLNTTRHNHPVPVCVLIIERVLPFAAEEQRKRQLILQAEQRLMAAKAELHELKAHENQLKGGTMVVKSKGASVCVNVWLFVYLFGFFGLFCVLLVSLGEGGRGPCFDFI